MINVCLKIKVIQSYDNQIIFFKILNPGSTEEVSGVLPINHQNHVYSLMFIGSARCLR